MLCHLCCRIKFIFQLVSLFDLGKRRINLEYNMRDITLINLCITITCVHMWRIWEIFCRISLNGETELTCIYKWRRRGSKMKAIIPIPGEEEEDKKLKWVIHIRRVIWFYQILLQIYDLHLKCMLGMESLPFWSCLSSGVSPVKIFYLLRYDIISYPFSFSSVKYKFSS